jgi:hypothetical protein
MGKHRAEYFRCEKCGFLFVGDPHWLPEAYRSPINEADTGILRRNIELSERAASVISAFFDKHSRFVDFAGGYGLFTRLMRDIGFDFYWHDPHTSNIFARGFEFPGGEAEAVTTFESFEHFVSPREEMEKISLISRNILCGTLLLPDPVPAPSDWWYYGLEHGQHISFYSRSAMTALAARFGLNFYTNGVDLHLFTDKKINPSIFTWISRRGGGALRRLLCRGLSSRTVRDMNSVIAREGKSR